MAGWLSWLFDPDGGSDASSSNVHQELRLLRMRRRALINNVCSLRAFGFDSQASEDEAALKSLDRKILALQLKRGYLSDPGDRYPDYS